MELGWDQRGRLRLDASGKRIAFNPARRTAPGLLRCAVVCNVPELAMLVVVDEIDG